MRDYDVPPACPFCQSGDVDLEARTCRACQTVVETADFFYPWRRRSLTKGAKATGAVYTTMRHQGDRALRANRRRERDREQKG